MENSDKLNLSSTPSKPTVPSMSSKSDENDQNCSPSIANSNLRKLGEIEKNVENKVLTERNEITKPEDCENNLPYDPLTNYLSPRPKFLRYEPSRRREIFLRRIGEESFLTTGCEDSVLVSHSSSSEEKVQTEMLEKENLDEEIEDEGDRSWTVKQSLKFLLVIASLVLCTAYITSMNTTTPSFEVSGEFRSGFCPISNQTADEFGSSLVVESLNENGSDFWDEEVSEVASEGVSQFNHLVDATEILNTENEGGKAANGDLVKVECTEEGVEEAREKPLAGGSINEDMADGEENVVESSEQLIFEEDGDWEKGTQSEISEEDEITEASNFNGFDEVNLLSDILTVAENEYIPQMEAVEKEETGEAESFELETSKITILERINSLNFTSNLVEKFKKLKSELIELMLTEIESVLKVVLGLSISSAILTCLVLSLQFKKKKVYKKEPAIAVSVEPLLPSPVAKADKVLIKESPLIKPIENIDSFQTVSSSIHSRDEMESFKELYHHEAPTVQLLGELVVGDVSGLKNGTIEVEDSNFPISIAEKPVSKNMNSGPEQALSEFSATSSPTYGSFTSKKKMAKKEVGGDGEVKSMTTPVRRSTRIRNRMVSP